jgi:hypothetical protein
VSPENGMMTHAAKRQKAVQDSIGAGVIPQPNLLDALSGTSSTDNKISGKRKFEGEKK